MEYNANADIYIIREGHIVSPAVRNSPISQGLGPVQLAARCTCGWKGHWATSRSNMEESIRYHMYNSPLEGSDYPQHMDGSPRLICSNTLVKEMERG